MEFNQLLPDGSMFYGLGLSEYIEAIQKAPPGTMIKVGELVPEKWMKCESCGAEMSEALTGSHSC